MIFWEQSNAMHCLQWEMDCVHVLSWHFACAPASKRQYQYRKYGFLGQLSESTITKHHQDCFVNHNFWAQSNQMHSLQWENKLPQPKGGTVSFERKHCLLCIGKISFNYNESVFPWTPDAQTAAAKWLQGVKWKWRLFLCALMQYFQI